ncbi:hypothetical protein F2Q69_00055218 [Brassica cretica]|uniref:Uncharacterized protein n=1 Tax=Brassica cretica TaxID=69181 RepID=A0A8S9N8S4_BRACR|nr:hypothetical protein F2Q69_00055218 [Brassica cretica]
MKKVLTIGMLGGNRHELTDVPFGRAPGKTKMHGLIIGSSKYICSLFDSYLRNHEAYTHEITCRMFSTQLRSSSNKNQIKQSSYVTVMPFTNQVIFSSREFRPPEKLEMDNLLSVEPTTNSIMPKNIFCFLVRLSPSKSLFRWTCASYQKTFRNPSSGGLVKMFEADQRRLLSQFEVREFCDNLVEGVVKPSRQPDFMLDKEQTIAELTFLQPEHPSSLVLFSQYFEENPFDYPHQGPLLDTRRPLDDDLGPIFDEEDELLATGASERPLDDDLGPIFDEEDELGPTFDEKALSRTSINMENHLCFDPGTILRL